MSKEISIVLSGEAGQGIKTVELLMAELLKVRKHYFFISREYMSRVRGGINSTQIIISDIPVNSYSDQTDLFITMTNEVPKRYSHRISSDTVVLTGERFIEIAKGQGNEKFANTAVFGYLCAYISADEKTGIGMIKENFKKRPELLEGNKKAFIEGFSLCDLQKNVFAKYRAKHHMIETGMAVAYGALFGGCEFIAAYPMSPSTTVLNSMAELSGEYNILVEQAEDEIAAVNMAIGASFAGARAMVTTSGGGFALMEEGVSLSGATETPVVIHLGQRPGPATGLPTRTEQGDLELVLYAGHGDFQRAVYSPGDQTDAIGITAKAFDTAYKYQVPVFILTDQYMIDSLKPIRKSMIQKPKYKSYIVKTDKDYERYTYTKSGISPMGIPSYGSGVVRVDSDEHDEKGRITEDHVTREKMVKKRNKRKAALEKDAIAPKLIGDESYKVLGVCYGSNLGHALDLAEPLKGSGISFLHFSQLYPISDAAKGYLDKASLIAVIENNYTGQFADMLKLRFGVNIGKRILKYNGEPFSRQEIEKALREAAE